MKTITIITPANIEVEYRLAGAGSRLSAFLIDFILQLLTIFIVFLAMWGMGVQFFDGLGGVGIGIFMVISFVIHFGYFIICEMTMNGQTIGKRILGLRAIRENGQPIGFSESLIRGLIRSSADMMYIGMIIIFFHPMHKRLGDMAAGTVVVSEKYSGFFMPTLSFSEWPHFLPSASDATDEERHIVEAWLRRRDGFTDSGVDLGQKIAKYFEAKHTSVMEMQNSQNHWDATTESQLNERGI